jgi:hypothetical protein
VAEPITWPCPRERADELAAMRSWLARNPVTVLDAQRPPAERVSGGRILHRLVDGLRALDRRPSDAD